MDLISNIDANVAKLNGVWGDPEGLSELLLRLAKQHYDLAGLVSDAELIANETEDTYKHSVEAEKIHLMESKSLSATAAESAARLEHVKIKDAWTQANHSYQLLKRKRESLQGIIDAGRSRLSLIKQDIRNS